MENQTIELLRLEWILSSPPSPSSLSLSPWVCFSPPPIPLSPFSYTALSVIFWATKALFVTLLTWFCSFPRALYMKLKYCYRVNEISIPNSDFFEFFLAFLKNKILESVPINFEVFTEKMFLQWFRYTSHLNTGVKNSVCRMQDLLSSLCINTHTATSTHSHIYTMDVQQTHSHAHIHTKIPRIDECLSIRVIFSKLIMKMCAFFS